MAALTISALAAQVGLSPSAIRYYERIGLLPCARRVSGQRRYGLTDVHRLGVIRRARQLGFTVDEVRQLFRSSANNAGAAESWLIASNLKLAELDLKITELQERQGVLRNIVRKCDCQSLEECGRRMLKNTPVPGSPGNSAADRSVNQ